MTEAIAKLEEITAEGLAQGAPIYSAILTGVEALDTPPHHRVRGLQLMGEYGAHFEALQKKAVVTIVNVISGEDNTPALIQAAIQALRTLCQKCVEKKAKNSEFLVRESADVLFQIMLDEDGFEAQSRSIAKECSEALTRADFPAIIAKLLHWISDQRENDEPTQVEKERCFALEKLTELACSPVYTASWTTEAEDTVKRFFTLVLPTITADEFSKMVSAMSGLPNVKASGCVPLIETVLALLKTDAKRTMDALALLAPFVPRTTVFNTLAEKLMPLIPKAMPDESGVPLVRATLLASRCCDAAMSEKILPVVHTLLLQNLAAELPASLTFLEGLLLSFAVLGHKAPTATLPLLTDETFVGKLNSMLSTITPIRAKLLFAIKKKVMAGSATQYDAALLATVENICSLGNAMIKKHLPISVTATWERSNALPTIKRAAEPAPSTSAADSNPAKKHRTTYQPPAARGVPKPLSLPPRGTGSRPTHQRKGAR